MVTFQRAFIEWKHSTCTSVETIDVVPQERIEVQMNTSSTTSNAIPVIESVTPALVVTFNPVFEYVSEDAAHAVSTLVAGDTAAAPASARAVSSPSLAVQQIIAEETTQDLVATPVCAGDIGSDTRWEQQCEVLRVGDWHYEGQLRVLHSHENSDDFWSGVWIPMHCFQPNGKCVCTRRRHWL